MKKTMLFAATLLLASMLYAGEQVQVDGIYYLLDRPHQTAMVTWAPNAYGYVAENTYNGNLVIPEVIWTEEKNGESNMTDYTVTAIGDSAFAKCPYLYSIIIPKTVETLGINLLAGSNNVTTLKINDGDKPIYFTFQQGTAREEISFGELSFSCTYLYLGRDVETKTTSEWASPVFHTWSAIHELVIGEQVTKIPDALCRFTRELKFIQINTSTPLAAGTGMLMFLSEPDANPQAITLYVPEGQKQAYATMDVWKQLNIEEMNDMRRYGIVFVDGYVDFYAGGLYYKIKKDENKNDILSANGNKTVEVVLPHVWYVNPDGSYVSNWSSEFPYKQSAIMVPQYVTYNDEQYEVTALGDYCFRNAVNLEELQLPISVTSIGGEAFEGCMKLKHLDLHNTVTYAGWLAFARSGLEEITIPTNINKWEMCAFQQCEYLTKVTFREGSETDTIPPRMFWGCTALRTITLPNSVKYIGEGCFAGCMALSHIDLPESLEVLLDRQFRGCPIRELHIPANVKEIYPDFLLGADLLSKLIVDPANTTFDSRQNCNAIIRSKDNTLVSACAGTTIPATVDSIAQGAFDELQNIYSLTLPANLKKIAENGLWNLENLRILKSEIENPAGVLSEYSIGSWYNDVFEDVTLYVPSGKAAAYKADAQWGKFKNIVETEPVAVTMIQPSEMGEKEVNFSNVSDDTDITNTVIDNLYVTCDTTAGDTYDSKEKAFVFQTIVDELQMSSILESPNKADAVRNNFAGIVLQVPTGEGTITITAQSTNNRSVAVTIENMEGIINGETTSYTTIYTNQPIKGDILIEYNVTADAYIYIYGAETIQGTTIELAPKKLAKRHNPQAVEDEPAIQTVSIYGVKCETKKVEDGVDTVAESSVATQKLIRNAQVIIVRDGKTYNVLGVEIK